MSTRILLCCLLLSCANLPLHASDVGHLSAGGNGGGADSDATARVGDDDAAATHDTKVRHLPPRTAPAVKTPASRSGGDFGNDIRPPRWHSFLPGMFR